jgi:hypothetical protein
MTTSYAEVQFSWNSVSGAVGYEIRYNPQGTYTWTGATVLATGIQGSPYVAYVPLGNWSFLICAIDKSGNYSPTPATCDLNVTSRMAFVRGGTVLNPSGAVNIIVWLFAEYASTVTAIKGWRVGGTGATINARKNGSATFLASDLSLTSASTVMDGGAVQNASIAAGNYVEIMITGLTGSVTQIGVQVCLTRN